MSFEKIKKEILTDDLIKRDIIYLFHHDGHIPTNIILITVSIFFAFLFSILTPFAWLLLLILALLLLLWYIRRRSIMKEIENGEFTVVPDELLYEKEHDLRTEGTFYKSRWISYLQFSNNGRWELDGYYYAWSDRYKMSDTGICNTSQAKDIFYVVLYHRTEKILIGYNTKFFDYQNKV